MFSEAGQSDVHEGHMTCNLANTFCDTMDCHPFTPAPEAPAPAPPAGAPSPDKRAEEIHRKFCGCFLTMEGRARGDCQTFAAVAAALDAAREEGRQRGLDQAIGAAWHSSAMGLASKIRALKLKA